MNISMNGWINKWNSYIKTSLTTIRYESIAGVAFILTIIHLIHQVIKLISF